MSLSPSRYGHLHVVKGERSAFVRATVRLTIIVVAVVGSLGVSVATASAVGSTKADSTKSAHARPVSGSSSPNSGKPEPVTAAPPIPPGATRISPLPSNKSLKVDVVLKPHDPSELAQYAEEVSTPGSPSYLHYLGSGQFSQIYGPSAQTIQSVESALKAQGLSPGHISADHLDIPVRASVSALAKGLSTSFSQYRLKSGRVAYANDRAPELPSGVASEIQDVAGLDNLVEAEPGAVHVSKTQKENLLAPKAVSPQVLTGGPQPCSAATTLTPSAYTADQIASAYGLPDLYSQGDEGQGQTVAVMEAEPNLASDIAAYQSCYGTSTSVSYVDIDGGPGSNGGGSGEAALDIEQIIGLAPKSKIVVYQTFPTLDSLYDGFLSAISNNSAQVISTSWGTCEAFATDYPDGSQGYGPWIAGLFDAENTLFEEAATQGQSVVAAAGDDGSEGCYPWSPVYGGYASELRVQDPAAQPFVTGVGGTTLAQPGAPSSETVWNSYYAGGGGISEKWPMPDYQANAPSGLGVTNTYSSGAPCNAALGDCREVPDVSADADPYTGYSIYWDGSWYGFGGTSAGAPLWAALLALTNASSACGGNPIGFANPALYSVAANDPGAFNDITVGNNDFTHLSGGMFPALPGYDMASGLGSPTANLPGMLCTYRTPNPLQFTSAASKLFDLGVSSSFSITTSGSPPPSLTESGTLPSGMAFSDSGGGTATLSGTPEQAGSFPVTLSASNGSLTQTQSFTLVVGSSPAITSQNSASFTAGTKGSYQMSASGSPTPSFSITQGSLPSGLQLSSTGKMVGAPGSATSGIYSITVQASNGISPASTKQFTVTVLGTPTFTSEGTATFVVNEPSSFTITTSAAPAPSLSASGSLPTGISFSDDGDGTAKLSGTPTAAGTYSLTIAANNNLGGAVQQLSVKVVSSSTSPAFTSASSATFTVGQTGSFQFTSTGTPAPTFSIVSGTAPLVADQSAPYAIHPMTITNSGLLSGWVYWDTGGTYNVVVEAYNGVAPAAFVNFTLTIEQTPYLFPISYDGSFNLTTTHQGSDLILNQPGQMQLRAVGYPVPSISEVGVLPTGVSFAVGADGNATISGTPTQPGEFTFTIEVSNSAGVETMPFTFFVAQAVAPHIVSANQETLSTETSSPYLLCASFPVVASGFPTPKLTEIGAVPDKVFVNDQPNEEGWDPGSANIGYDCTTTSGVSGSYPLVFTATNSAGSTTQDFTLTLSPNPPVAPVFTSAQSAGFVTGGYNAFMFQVGSPQGADGCGPATTSALPSGVFMSTSDGLLYGIPSPGSEGTYPLNVSCPYWILVNSQPHIVVVTQSFTLYVTGSGPPTITSSPGVTFAEGYQNTFTIKSNGFPVATISEIGSLPTGISFTDNGDGTATLSGTPAEIGSFPITISCTNTVGTTDQSFSLLVTQPQAPAITSSSSAVFNTSSSATFQLLASGSPPPTFSIASGSLPPGINLGSAGLLSGRALAGGDYPVVVSASNGVSPDASQNLDVQADEAPQFLGTGASGTYTGSAPISATFTAKGYPLASFGALGLPAGMTVVDNGVLPGTPDEATATVSGTPVGIPGGTVTYPVNISASNNFGASITRYSVMVTLPPLAVITGMTPASGPAAGGTKVTISGSNFKNASAVKFGANNATSFTVNGTGTTITAYTPVEQAGLVSVTVTTPAGTATGPAPFVFGAPAISSISPTSGTTAGGTKVTIKGSYLQGASSVRFGTTAASYTVNTAGTQIIAYTPSEAAGSVPVIVNSPGGSATAPIHFVFGSTSITSISPTSGPNSGGTKVVIKGTYLKGASSVKFGATTATSFTVNSYGTAITAYTPAEAAGSATITVTTPAGTAQAPTPFLFLAPSITSISPTSGSTAGGTKVTIKGKELKGASSVHFGTLAATSFTVNSYGTAITAYTPAEAPGLVTISVTVPGVTLDAPTEFNYS